MLKIQNRSISGLAIHPTESKGKWTQRRTLVHGLLLGFFLSMPWIRINGRPFLLFDIVDRRFTFFGVLFRAHDVPLVFLLVIGFLLTFALLTTLFGRVWCGWACPQTVFIDFVFRKIERLTEGSSFTRRKNDGFPLDFNRGVRKVSKWVLWTVVSSFIAHSFLSLFTGPERLRQMIEAGPVESPYAFGFALATTLLILFDFGWFREQFCIIVCPYGRIQSLFQDPSTRTVTYDIRRGEPRAPLRRAFAADAVTGDCVDCSRCVGVCPTGIDIRNGSSQLECIACTACMDACDDVMGRLGRAKGLIRYASALETAPLGTFDNGELSAKRSFRPWAYGIGITAAATLLLFSISQRKPALIEIFKNRGAPFITIVHSGVHSGPEPLYANLFMAEMTNQSDEDVEINFSVESTELSLIMPNNPIRLTSGSILKNPFTLSFPKSALISGRAMRTLKTTTRGLSTQQTTSENKEISLVGPF